MRLDRMLLAAAASAMFVVIPVATAPAQSLGPQRQFLAVEPYYEYTRVNLGSNAGTANANGYGARLWINGAPFHFPLNSSIALFGSYAPDQNGIGNKTVYYGGQVDQFFVRRPFGGIIDPFISVGAGAYYRSYGNYAGYAANANGLAPSHTTRFALSPGGGIRIPIPNRFELRGDVKDLMIFRTPDAGTGLTHTSNNLLVQAGLGMTF